MIYWGTHFIVQLKFCFLTSIMNHQWPRQYWTRENQKVANNYVNDNNNHWQCRDTYFWPAWFFQCQLHNVLISCSSLRLFISIKTKMACYSNERRRLKRLTVVYWLVSTLQHRDCANKCAKKIWSFWSCFCGF